MKQKEQFFSGLNDFLYAFVKECPHYASLKDAKTGQYIFANLAMVKICGFDTVEQIIGLTIRDIDQMIYARWGKAYASIIEDLDKQVKTLQNSVQDERRVLLDNNGFVRIQNTIKHPVRGYNRHIIAILTYSYDITKDTNLFHLFGLYKKMYKKKQVAIENFLRYLKISDYFREKLTEAELMILICMRYNQLRKDIARRLDIQTKTVEVHLANIRGKLNDGHLNELLEVLRG